MWYVNDLWSHDEVHIKVTWSRTSAVATLTRSALVETWYMGYGHSIVANWILLLEMTPITGGDHRRNPISIIFGEAPERQVGVNSSSTYIWLVVEPPLWKIWFRQLGLLLPIYGKMFQTTSYGLWYIQSSFMGFFPGQPGSSAVFFLRSAVASGYSVGTSDVSVGMVSSHL